MQKKKEKTTLEDEKQTSSVEVKTTTGPSPRLAILEVIKGMNSSAPTPSAVLISSDYKICEQSP
jgi:rRNA processing protein Krr1/Pno1